MAGHAGAVQAIYAAFGAGDVAGVLAHIAEDVDWDHDWEDPLPLYRSRRGHAGVRAFFAELAPYEFLRFEPVAFLEDGDLVAVPIRLQLRHRDSGREFRDLEMHLWTFGPDGKVARLRHLLDTRGFARMAGLG